MGMHACQRKPEKIEVEASNYMCLIRPLLFGPHPNQHFILNMDQTPVHFSISMKKMLELVGKKTLHFNKEHKAGDLGCDDCGCNDHFQGET